MRPAAAPPSRGWTLIEMLLVLGIVGVLTQWALPSATEWVQRARRNEARLALLQCIALLVAGSGLLFR